jgi:hypothetical protein
VSGICRNGCRPNETSVLVWTFKLLTWVLKKENPGMKVSKRHLVQGLDNNQSSAGDFVGFIIILQP